MILYLKLFEFDNVKLRSFGYKTVTQFRERVTRFTHWSVFHNLNWIRTKAMLYLCKKWRLVWVIGFCNDCCWLIATGRLAY